MPPLNRDLARDARGERLWAVAMADTRGTRRESQTDWAGKMGMEYKVRGKPRQERAAISMLEKASIATYYPAQGVLKIVTFGHVPAQVEPALLL